MHDTRILLFFVYIRTYAPLVKMPGELDDKTVFNLVLPVPQLLSISLFIYTS